MCLIRLLIKSFKQFWSALRCWAGQNVSSNIIYNTNCIKVTFVYMPLIKLISHQPFSPQILMFFNCCNITFLYIFINKKFFYNFASHSQKSYTFPMVTYLYIHFCALSHSCIHCHSFIYLE